MAEYVEGKRPVIEAMKTDVPLKKILLADNAKRDPMVNDILRKARQREIPVIDVPRAELDSKSARGSHQGVMAETKPFPYKGIGDIVDAAESYAAEHNGRALVVVCDHLTDAGNLGAIIRTADCAGAHGVIIPKRRNSGLTAVVAKSSAGAMEYLPIARVNNLAAVMKQLKDREIWIYGTAADGAESLYRTDLTGPCAIVIGSEGSGIGRLVAESCDFMVSIPMKGHIDSLNASNAAAILLYEAVRQRMK